MVVDIDVVRWLADRGEAAACGRQYRRGQVKAAKVDGKTAVSLRVERLNQSSTCKIEFLTKPAMGPSEGLIGGPRSAPFQPRSSLDPP